MRCSECNFENKPEAKFCTGCGTKLVAPITPSAGGVRCSECNAENKPDAKFCSSCGMTLIAPTPSIGAGLVCSECKAENKPEAKFCNSCGATLVIPATSTGGGMRCPECDFENAPEAKFCSSCGATLVAETTFCTDCGTKIPSGQQFCGQCAEQTTRPDVPQPREPQLSTEAPKPKSHKLKWGAIALVALMVVAGGAVAGVVLTSDSSGNKFEEASQIYGLDADCPAQIGYLEKISETPLTNGLEEMGAIRGRILEYEDGSDHVLVMAYTFASQNSARQAFDRLEGDWLDTDFYMMDSDGYGGYFCRLIEDVIYLASGTIDNVVTVTDGIASANCL